MAHRSLTILSALLVASATTLGHAAELGEAQVLSHIGQALVADVELTLIEDPAAKVGVRLAHPDVYRGASIAMPPVLSSLNMTVMRRDGRQFLHLTSLKPVESRMLHVYLELVDGGQRNVRLVTLWLTPDPNPAPPPVREPVAEAVKAAPVLPVPVPPAPRPAAALQAGEEYVDAVRHPAPAPRKPSAQALPVAKPALQRKAVPAAASGGTPACAAPAPNEHANACVALGAKNAALHEQLGTLEEKVRALQGAAHAAVPAPAPATAHAPATTHAPATAPAPATVSAPAASPAPAAEAAAAAAHASAHASAPAPAAQEAEKPAPKGAPRIHRKPKKPVPPEPETPWLAIGGAIGAVLAVGALVLMALRRRKRSSVGKIAAEHKPVKLPTADDLQPKPNFMAAVKARLMPGRGKEAAPPVVPVAEPVE